MKIYFMIYSLGRKNYVISYYQTVSMFILSSRLEGFTNALCEAMACCCSSITFDCKTGASNIIDSLDMYKISSYWNTILNKCIAGEK